ncbi:Stage II sporulation protein E (SpoIIE) [Caballeronia fortuita]|uniref:Stage II sporulation protein E (SpoIIE) n=1 Tax=Caballeronia fortuita TaxID=1777138 RepID=A0A158CMY2_9BURK|nr:SpoIIE family protein phosphatase [Caballeronia fortuita]SAK83619.1 Stage II sporulation protein E (SpoIIE) [Caballeronia fortuita]
MMTLQQRYEISTEIHGISARRAAIELAHGLGFDEMLRDKLAVFVTECANHLLETEERGELVMRPLVIDNTPGASRHGVEVLLISRGQGTADLHIGSQLHRLPDEFEFWSSGNLGTVLRAALWNTSVLSDPPAAPLASVPYGVVSLALEGESVNGDAWACHTGEDHFTVLLADGLGHGTFANRAASEAAESLAENGNAPLEEIVHRAHAMLRSTVGAAVGVARVPITSSTTDPALTFAGVGNISASVWTERSHKHLPSHDGVVGHRVRRVQSFSADCPSGSLVVLHSDGLKSRWDLSRYPGLWVRHPALIAAVLYRDFAREHDDLTVFVVRADQRPSV